MQGLHAHIATSPSSATVNKGVGVENIHYLGDGLWLMKDHV